MKDLTSFGKYRYNLIIDETVGLHYLGPEEVFSFKDNHRVVYDWYVESEALYKQRAETFNLAT